jgi:hypothetical protein
MAIFAAIFAVVLLMLVVFYWRQFSQEDDGLTREWMVRWTVRGVAAPILVWMVMNAGRLPFMPPLTTHIASLRATGHYLDALVAQTSLVAVVIVSCWAALTFGWFLAGLIRRARNREDLFIAMFVWLPAMVLIFWIAMSGWGWPGGCVAAVLSLWPFAEYSLSVADFKQPAPAYSGAIGKIKFGKYAEAEKAIVGELEKCESDFDGWMMLADLYAHQFHDVAEAERTICELCDDPNTTLPQISIALHRLADWQLKLRGDPESARRMLEAICARMPGTHLANMARVRINQLPASVDEMNERQKIRTVHMPALSEDFNAATEQPQSPVSPQAALAAADQLVEKLNADPKDTPVREKLAHIFAEQLGRLDLGVEQLELLAEMPQQPPEKVAEWLGQIAAWQIRLGGEAGFACKTLERLVREFPHSAQAFAAQRRLSLLNREAKIRKSAPAPQKAESG